MTLIIGFHHANQTARPQVAFEGAPWSGECRCAHKADLVIEIRVDLRELGVGLPLGIEIQRPRMKALESRHPAYRTGGDHCTRTRGSAQNSASAESTRLNVPEFIDSLLMTRPPIFERRLMSLLCPRHQEVVRRCAVGIFGLRVHHRDVVAACDLARQAGATTNANRLARIRQTDASAEEQVHLPLEALRADVELAGILQESRALGKEQLEAREIDLLLVDFPPAQKSVFLTSSARPWPRPC